MDGQRPLTGWEIEGRIMRLLEGAPAGTSYCVLCVAEALGETSAERYLEVAKALRRVGAYNPDKYVTFTGKCETHTGPRERGKLTPHRRQCPSSLYGNPAMDGSRQGDALG